MTTITPQTISVQHVSTPETLTTLIQSFNGLPNNPASVYLSGNLHNLTIYVAPACTVNIVSLSYLAQALQKGEESASALKRYLEDSPATKVFFDARVAARFLFDRCGIKLADKVQLTLNDIEYPANHGL